MSLEKITGAIISSAESQARELIENAEKTAREIISAAQAEDNLSISRIREAGEKKAALIASNANSACRLDAKNKLLAAKSKLISQAFSQSLERLNSLGDDDYFNLIRALLEKHADTGKGELIMSQRDKERMPSGFMSMTALSDGRSVVLSEQSDDSIEGGFILKYNDIEINCTFNSLLEADRERLVDLVSKVLFDEH